MSVSENLLLKRFAVNGDAEAFAEIAQRHAPLVYGVCLRIISDKDIAADAVQDTFIQLVRNADTISGSLPNWLHRVAKNRSIELVRQDSSRKRREVKYANDFEKKQSQEDNASWQEISGYIDEELDDLDDQTREILILHFFEGRTMTYIAEKLGISQPTVSRRIESGIELLRLKLKSRGIIVPAAVFMTLLSENIVKAVPASIMKELGKIAIAGGKAAIGAKIASSISAGIAVKTKIMVGMLIVLLGASLTVVFSFIANGENKPVSAWELVSSSLRKESSSEPNQNITVSELLDRYASTQEKLVSFIAKAESSVNVTTLSDGKNHHIEAIAEGRFDGKKANVRLTSWGEINSTMDIPKDKPYYKSSLWNGEDYYAYNRSQFKDVSSKGSLVIRKNAAEVSKNIRESTCGEFAGSIAIGYIPQTNERIDTIIRNAESKSIRNKMEKVGDSDCYIIEAKTKSGSYAVWIDPSHDYNIAKFELKRGPGDMLGNGYILPENDSASISVNNIQFKKINDIWIPMEAELNTERHNLTKESTHYKITEFVLNPDHNALKSFVPDDISDGARVRILESNSDDYVPINYTWQDGKVIDSYGYEVNLSTMKPPALTGKTLPSIAEFGVALEPDVFKNNKLLLCFFDYSQRPSRNCVLSLNEKAQSLLDKDIYLIFIQAESVTEQTLAAWLTKNEIVPPVGTSKSDLPALGHSWGVQSLPWLILTDKSHKVIAEGFSINDLDEKIK